MRRHARPMLLAVLLLGLLAGPSPAATPTALKQAYIVYQTNGRIPPCVLPAETLKKALSAIGGDSAQYSPDFKDAIKTAIEAAASGQCDKKKPATAQHTPATPPPAATGSGQPPPAAPTTSVAATTAQPASTVAKPAPVLSTPQPAPQVDPAPAVADSAIPVAASTPSSSGTDDAPAPLVVLAGLLALLLALTAVFAAARATGFNPQWLTRWRHAGQEAGWRASAAWSEFTDWVRLGR